MLRDCLTDVVCVSTFPPSHEEVALNAIHYPIKGILVEKPIGHTVESGRKILESIKKKQIPMVVPHGLLAKNTPLEIIQHVHSGQIGDLKLVEIQCNKWDIINAGIHWLNFFVYLTQNEQLEYVMAICESSTRTYRDGMQVETTAVTYAQTKSGIRVVMNTGDNVKVNREGKETLFRIIGTKGHIEFWAWENGYYILNEEHPKGRHIIPDELQVIGHQRYLEQLAEMIWTGKPDYAIPESSLAAMEIVEGAYLSSRTNCKVTFPVDRFSVPQQDNPWIPGIPYNGTNGGRDGRKL
jgi:predicted dehydrogenase